MESKNTKNWQITRINGNAPFSDTEVLAVEEPLEIRLAYYQGFWKEKSISITMRTPGNDKNLALGFLFAEGIINSYDWVKEVSCPKQNTIVVKLKEDILPNLQHSDRNFYTTSSCGVCGKASLNDIRTVDQNVHLKNSSFKLTCDVLYSLPKQLKNRQSCFTATGGIHAAGLFNDNGTIMFVHEDVGRHNALDKLIGNALQQQLLPLDHYVLLLSGRSSFELVQKAITAGISIVAAIGAPSSLAVALAEEFNITLVGFLKENRCNVYTHPHRILVNSDCPV